MADLLSSIRASGFLAAPAPDAGAKKFGDAGNLELTNGHA